MGTKDRIYLDNNASTLLDPRVKKVIIDELNATYGNPSSIHAFGQDVRNRITKSRRIIAETLSVKPSEIIFTSGATEGINMLLRGFFETQNSGHVITSNVEHSAVYTTLQALEEKGIEVSYLSPGLHGALTPEAVKAAIKPSTKLIMLMAVNNETGVKTDLEAIAKVALQADVPFIVDGVALLGKEIFSIPKGVSAMCFSGHKFHAPKGIGFNFVRNGFKVTPLITGGGQESNKRGGTENVSGIIGLAEAMRVLPEELREGQSRMDKLCKRLEEGVKSGLEGVYVNGSGPRVVNTINLSFNDVDGESLLLSLDLEGLAVSHGSACSSGALEPSRILLNMGIHLSLARSSIRFSLSRMTTEEEIERAIEIVVRTVKRLRAIG
jgi:cysteine desulfurase